MDILLFFTFIIFVLFLLRKHLPKGSVFYFRFFAPKKSSGAVNHLFQSIAFELTISGIVRRHSS